MLKKLISIFLCAALAVISAISVSAESKITGKNRNYTYVTKYTLKDQQAGFFTYNITDTTARIQFHNLSTNETTTVKFFDIVDRPTYMSMGEYTYEQIRFVSTIGRGGFGVGGGKNLNFSNTGGGYERIRIKLSDYISGIKEDGTVTKNGHTYNFKRQIEGATIYESALIFESGGAFTLAAPDKNGMVEIVVSTKIGQPVYYSTDFTVRTATGGEGLAGGANRDYLYTLTYGNCDDNRKVDISDATAIQQNLAYMVNFDAIQIRNGDMNKNGKIDVSDATLIQEFIAGIK